MVVLPEKYFTKTENVLDDNSFSLDGNNNLFDSINSGSFDISKLVDENTDMELIDTISAPKINIQPVEEKPQEKETSAPTQINPEDNKRLEGIESSLSNLDKQIKNITDSLNKQPPKQSEINSVNATGETLNNPKTEKKDNSGIIEVVKKERVINNNKAVDSKEFNTERLTELISTRNKLMLDRQKILQSVYFSNEGSNKNIFNEVNKEENNNESVDQQNNNTVNNKNSTYSVNNSENNFVENNTPSAPLQKVDNVTNNENTSNLTRNEFLNSTVNTSNESLNGPETPNVIETKNNKENLENITNNTQNSVSNYNTVNEQNLPDENPIKNFEVKDQNNISDLPPPVSEISENANNIISVLGEIREGIKTLNSGLGGNFQKLGSSIEGIKNNVINNNTFNGKNVAGGSSPDTQEGTRQRTPMPDYRSDLPDTGDFPPKFDLSTLGGTNLQNPQFIL
jgi:hypothetical protein